MTDYRALARQAASAAGIDADLFERQIEAESSFNPNARSAYASGIAQITPSTARAWGVDPMNPREALYEAARRMAGYRNKYGNYRDSLTAYNAGEGRVGKPLYAETQNYINKIMGGSTPSAQPSSAATTGVSAAPTDRRTRLLESIFKGTPYEGLATQRAATESSAPAGAGGTPVVDVGDVPEGGKDWRWLQNIARTKFGLVNDPGDSQTTGGRHSANSRHYAGKALDVGDARNSREQLNAWYNWALANRQKYGFTEVLDEGDHIHVAF